MARSAAHLPYKLNNYKIIRDRELGLRKAVGDDDDLSRKVYSNLDAYDNETHLPANVQKFASDQGGIFNLEFSPDGQLLVAACEGKSVLLFDAYNSRFINKIPNAHLKCVNCIRFLDHNTFASCSDDRTIKTWDLRFLKASTRTLQGHTNWVKNIEYSAREKVLVTSGFDGSVCTWNLNEVGAPHSKVFTMSGLMRMKLTPDDSKMVITTTTGYMIIVHDLNLGTMAADLKDFQPYLYRLMQKSEEALPAATAFNPVFMSCRNRIEFIDDFPDSAEVISSVQIHPMGWNALSRNVTKDNKTEWTCVHDIQMKEPKDYDDIYVYVDSPSVLPDAEDSSPPPSNHFRLLEQQQQPVPDIWQSLWTLGNQRWAAHHAIASDPPPSYIDFLSSGLIRGTRTPPSPDAPQHDVEKNRIVRNLPRMTHYVQELAMGKGYIKELCFSSDGRVIGSPHANGVRLLAFDSHLQEICRCVPAQPSRLFVVAQMQYHLDVAVSCKFNPRHYQMVSGGLGGDILWYRPNI